jgi:hypothetical protein
MNMIENVVLSDISKALIKNRIYFEQDKSIRNIQEKWMEHNDSIVKNDVLHNL